MTGAGFARTGPGVQADIIRDPLDSTLRLSSPEPERSAAQSADCAPSFSGRTITQASQAASSVLMENFRLLAAGGIAGAVSKTVTAPLARLTILYQVRQTCHAIALEILDFAACSSFGSCAGWQCRKHHALSVFPPDALSDMARSTISVLIVGWSMWPLSE